MPDPSERERLTPSETARPRHDRWLLEALVACGVVLSACGGTPGSRGDDTDGALDGGASTVDTGTLDADVVADDGSPDAAASARGTCSTTVVGAVLLGAVVLVGAVDAAVAVSSITHRSGAAAAETPNVSP